MEMKKLYTFLASFLILGASFAQNAAGAKAILGKVNAKLKNSNGISANFSYSIKDRSGNSKGSASGQLFIAGSKYHIVNGDNEIYSNGQKVWNYDKSAKEVNVSTAGSNSGGINPDKILSGNFSDADFNLALISQAGSFDQIKLTPKDLRKNFKQVILFVSKSQSVISKATVLDKSGNTTTFNLSNIKTNVSIAASQFEFNPKAHPGVEVID
jgi:outer membrane lipoprotein carrier protein